MVDFCLNQHIIYGDIKETEWVFFLNTVYICIVRFMYVLTLFICAYCAYVHAH